MTRVLNFIYINFNVLVNVVPLCNVGFIKPLSYVQFYIVDNPWMCSTWCTDQLVHGEIMY